MASLAELGLHVASILTIMTMTYLWKPNPLFWIAQHLALGVISARAFVTAVFLINELSLNPLASGNFLMIVPISLGIISYTVLHRKYSWMSRYAYTVSIGGGLGAAFGPSLRTFFVNLLEAVSMKGPVDIILFIATFCTFAFFIFHKEPDNENVARVLRTVRKIGRYALLLYFGVYMTSFFLGEVGGLALGMSIPILKDWLGLI